LDARSSRESFAFKAVPLICGQATLTVAAMGMIQDDVTWKGNKLTVLGESGEVLGNLFEEDESLMSTQVGGPVFDTIAISAEKMIEFTGDGDFEFTLYSQTGMTGNLKLRYMKLGFRCESCIHINATLPCSLAFRYMRNSNSDAWCSCVSINDLRYKF
jgi:hypothetical protein